MGFETQSYLQIDPSKNGVKTSQGKWYHLLCLGPRIAEIRLESKKTIHSSGRRNQWVWSRRHCQLLIPKRHSKRQEDFNNKLNTSGEEKGRVRLCNGHEQNHVYFTEAFDQRLIVEFKIYRRHAQNYLF